MTETLPNPVLKENLDDSAFLEAAQKADRGEDFQLPSAEQSDTRATDTTAAEDTSTNPDTTLETDKAERPRDAQGRFTKTEDGTDIPESERKPADQADTSDAQAEGKESEYQKKAREREALGEPSQIEKAKRLEREARQYREDAIRYQRELEEVRARYEQQSPQQRNGQQQFSSQQYAEAAEGWASEAEEARKAGDYDKADELAVKAARAARYSLEVAKQEQAASQQDWQQQMYQHLNYDAEQAMTREPELRNPESPLGQETGKILEEYGAIIDQIPLTKLRNGQTVGGFTLATEFAKLRLKAGAASGLEEENKKLKARLQEAEQRTALGRGGAGTQVAPQSPESMSDAEFLRAAEAADAGRY